MENIWVFLQNCSHSCLYCLKVQIMFIVAASRTAVTWPPSGVTPRFTKVFLQPFQDELFLNTRQKKVVELLLFLNLNEPLKMQLIQTHNVSVYLFFLNVKVIWRHSCYLSFYDVCFAIFKVK